MRKQTKIILTIGSMVTAGIGTIVLTKTLVDKNGRIEREKQLLVESLKRFIHVNKLGIYDYDTYKYARELVLDGKKLSEKQIGELLDIIRLK